MEHNPPCEVFVVMIQFCFLVCFVNVCFSLFSLTPPITTNPVQNSSTLYQHEDGGNLAGSGGGGGYFSNPIFDLIPKKQSSLDDINFLKAFIKRIPELFKKGNLLQKYVLLKYVMESYESCLKQQEKARQVKKGKKGIGRSAAATHRFDATRDQHTIPGRHFLLQDNATTINNYSQPHAASLGNTSNDNDDENNGFRLNPGLIDDNELFALPPMAMVDGGDDDDDQDNNFVAQYHKDLLQLAEEFKHSMESFNFHTDIDEEQQSRVSSSLNNNAPSINLDSFTDDNLLPSMLDLLPKNRQEQQKLTRQTYEVSSKTVETAEAVKETSRSQGHYNLRPRRSCLVESLFSESPPPTLSRNRRSAQGRNDKDGAAATSTQRRTSPQRPPRPRPYYLTEEEYSLRLPMPKRKIVPIGPIPKVQSKRVLSELSYYPIDFTIAREEFSYERHKRDDFVNLTLPTTAAEATVGSQTLSSSVIVVTSDDDGNVLRSQSLPQSQQQPQQMLQQQQYLSSNISNSLVEVRQAVSADLVDAGVSLQMDNNLSVIGEEGGGRANTSSGLQEKSMIQHGIGIADKSDLLIEIPPAVPAG